MTPVEAIKASVTADVYALAFRLASLLPPEWPGRVTTQSRDSVAFDFPDNDVAVLAIDGECRCYIGQMPVKSTTPELAAEWLVFPMIIEPTNPQLAWWMRQMRKRGHITTLERIAAPGVFRMKLNTGPAVQQATAMSEDELLSKCLKMDGRVPATRVLVDRAKLDAELDALVAQGRKCWAFLDQEGISASKWVDREFRDG